MVLSMPSDVNVMSTRDAWRLIRELAYALDDALGENGHESLPQRATDVLNAVSA